MARARSLTMAAALVSGCLALLSVAGCGPAGSKDAAPTATAQPADTPAASGQRPSPAADAAGQSGAQAPRPPVQPKPEPAPAEPEGTAPVVTGPPEDRTVLETGPFSLKVTAKGTEPLAYQWTKDGRPELLSNEAEFWMANPKIEDSGTYTVEISNRWGKTTASCRLTVNPRLKRP